MTTPKQEVPGTELYRYTPFGATTFLQRVGSGENAFRTNRFSQPNALQVGDILATGDEVLSPPRAGCNGSVWLHLTGGFEGHWVEVASRFPLALLTEDDEEYEALRKMAIEGRPKLE